MWPLNGAVQKNISPFFCNVMILQRGINFIRADIRDGDGWFFLYRFFIFFGFVKSDLLEEGQRNERPISLTLWPVNCARRHQLSGHFLWKTKQKYHGSAQGPNLDFTRWWVVALKSRPDLFFLLASPSSPFHWCISQSPLPADTCTHCRAANIIPLKYSSFTSAVHCDWNGIATYFFKSAGLNCNMIFVLFDTEPESEGSGLFVLKISPLFFLPVFFT